MGVPRSAIEAPTLGLPRLPTVMVIPGRPGQQLTQPLQRSDDLLHARHPCLAGSGQAPLSLLAGTASAALPRGQARGQDPLSA